MSGPKSLLYFGCLGRAGHYWWTPSGGRRTMFERDGPLGNPWNGAIDGGLLSKTPGQVQGIVTITHNDGWTALSFWDRSVDSRGGSNSSFVAEGTWTYDEMLSAARRCWPQVFERIKFKITEDSS